MSENMITAPFQTVRITQVCIDQWNERGELHAIDGVIIRCTVRQACLAYILLTESNPGEVLVELDNQALPKSVFVKPV